MKTIQRVVVAMVLILAGKWAVAQDSTPLQFTSVNTTAENAIQLHWASNPNEVYEIDYADQLAGNDDGSTLWQPLYTDYPSHGTNTFIADAGNYDITPQISHPKLSPMRFYRVTLVQANDSATNPAVAITAPTNGASLAGDVTISVLANSDDILTSVRLFVDGEEQWASNDGTNFLINTCEWPNGSHTIFATAKSQSGLEGAANGDLITYGRAVSSFVNVTFDNLITRFDFSEPFFEPELGQTQRVTAVFTANCDWTLAIKDAGLNTVRYETGSGSAMEFDWDGTGTNGANLPNGVYSYDLTAQTNGQAFMSLMSRDGSSLSGPSTALGAASEDTTQLWALAPESSGPPLPLAIYPPGMLDTNGFTIFEATPSEVRALTEAVMAADKPARAAKTSMLMAHTIPNGGVSAASYSSSSQNTTGPKRKPSIGVKGAVGSFGICYKTYGTNGFSSPHPITGWPWPLPTLIALDGQSRNAQTVDKSVPSFKDIANDFSALMQNAGWKPKFVKPDNQWTASDIKKTSLGGNSIFNTCNFGILMAHGSYNSGTAGADAINHTYVWLGGNDYVKLADMDFGSPETNGLRWMTILACNMLQIDCLNSMIAHSATPVNGDLHLLMGCATTAWANTLMGTTYATNLLANIAIPQAWYNCGRQAYHVEHRGMSNNVVYRVFGNGNCRNDTLALYNDPDPAQDGWMDDETVFDTNNP